MISLSTAWKMARDIINGIYVPRMEHIDLNYILDTQNGYDDRRKTLKQITKIARGEVDGFADEK